jgi:putative oxidoreductase
MALIREVLGDLMLSIILWALQVLLAVAFLAHGWLFLSPPATMVEQMNAAFPQSLRILIGGAEVLAAIGLILPGITHILPSLVSSAAAGLAIVMICATVFHIARGELSSAAVTAVLLALASFVAYMRWQVSPIRTRSAASTVDAAGQERRLVEFFKG